MAKMTLVRVLISIVSKQWPLFELDVKNDFLHGIFMKKFICNLMRATLNDSIIVDILLQLHQKLSPEMGEPLENPTRYRKLVGAFYLIIIRLDIAHALHVVSQFVQAPTSAHYATLLRILYYLYGTISQSLLFSSTSSLELCAFCDED